MNMNNFEKGIVDFLRQKFVGNEHFLMEVFEGRWPEEEENPHGHEDFIEGFEFARRMADTEPSQESRDEILVTLRKFRSK